MGAESSQDDLVSANKPDGEPLSTSAPLEAPSNEAPPEEQTDTSSGADSEEPRDLSPEDATAQAIRDASLAEGESEETAAEDRAFTVLGWEVPFLNTGAAAGEYLLYGVGMLALFIFARVVSKHRSRLSRSESADGDGCSGTTESVDGAAPPPPDGEDRPDGPAEAGIVPPNPSSPDA